MVTGQRRKGNGGDHSGKTAAAMVATVDGDGNDSENVNNQQR